MDINITDLLTLKNALIASASLAAGKLLMGKAVRRILLLPFQKIAEKTATKEDDIIVKEAAKDLEIEDKQ
jgi:hypothetical protein